jgi:hypothetical protein
MDIKPEKGEIVLDLDRPRTLRVDYSTIILFENQTKVSFQKAFSEEGFSFRYYRDLIWAGLVHQDPELTPKEVEGLVSQAPGKTYGEKMAYVINAISAVLEVAMPKKEMLRDQGQAPGTGTKPDP